MKPRKPTAAEHDSAYRAIGCTDGPKSRLEKLRDRDRVVVKGKRK